MARSKGSANFAGSLEVLAEAPVDARTVVNTKSDLYAAGSYPYAYVGMIVSVKDTGKAFILTATPATTEANWKEVGGGSSLPTGGTTGQALVKHSNSDGDVEWATVSGLEYEEKTLISSDNSYNNAALVSNGETKIFYSYWDAGLTVSDPHLPNCESNAIARHFYTEMTKATDGLSFTQRCRVFYTKSNVNYVRVYDRRCTSSGGTWTYPDWTEETPDLDSKYDTGDAASTNVADADYFPFYDTSASAKKKSLWSNIKSLLKTYFDTLYQGKLTAGSNITMSGNTINATLVRDNYSTTEQVIGKWITGKPLYQKTVNLGSLVTGTNTKAHSVSNMGIIVSCTGFWYDGSSYYGPIPEAEEGNIFIYIYANATNIKIDCSNHYNGCPAYATIQYTKTTD